MVSVLLAAIRWVDVIFQNVSRYEDLSSTLRKFQRHATSYSTPTAHRLKDHQPTILISPLLPLFLFSFTLSTYFTSRLLYLQSRIKFRPCWGCWSSAFRCVAGSPATIKFTILSRIIRTITVTPRPHGGQVRARPWKPKYISMDHQDLYTATTERSSRVHTSQETLVADSSIYQLQLAPTLDASSVSSKDDITLVASMSSTPDEERPKTTRFLPVSVHPDLPGAASAVNRTNHDLNTDNDPFKHGKPHRGESISFNTCNVGVLTGCK